MLVNISWDIKFHRVKMTYIIGVCDQLYIMLLHVIFQYCTCDFFILNSAENLSGPPSPLLISISKPAVSNNIYTLNNDGIQFTF